MKKHLIGFSFLAIFLFISNFAYSQLTFVNNTACDVKVTGVISTSATPCTVGPYCQATTILVPAFSVGTVPAPPCIGTGTSSSFVRVLVRTSGSGNIGVSICGSAIAGYTDCTGTARTLQQFSGNFAAIF